MIFNEEDFQNRKESDKVSFYPPDQTTHDQVQVELQPEETPHEGQPAQQEPHPDPEIHQEEDAQHQGRAGNDPLDQPEENVQ